MKCDGSLSAHSTVPHTESVTGEWRGDHAKPPKPTSGERLDVCGWRQSRMVSLVFFFVHTGYVRAGRRTTCSRRASNGRYLPIYRTDPCPDDQDLFEIKPALNKLCVRQGYTTPRS